MRDDDLTYDQFLNSVTIQDVLEDAGYRFNRREGLRYPSFVRMDSNGNRIRGDKFLLTPNRKCCFQPPEMKVYNVVSFIKTFPHFFSDYRAGMSPDYLVNLVCNRLLNNPMPRAGASVVPQTSQKKFDINNYELDRFMTEDRESQKNFFSFFRPRGIDLYTQYSFAKHFFIANRTTQDGKKYSNLAFPIYLPGDSKFNIVGLEERGRVKADEISGYKGKAPGSNSSEGLWIANLSGKSLDRAEKVMWFESAFDAMAYHQIHREDKYKTKAVYISTGGNPTEKQFKGFLSVAPKAEHRLCFDNDEAGNSFVLNFKTLTGIPQIDQNESLAEYKLSLRNRDDILSGDESLLPKSLMKLYARYETLSEEYYSSKCSRLVCKDDLDEIAEEAKNAKREYINAIKEAFDSEKGVCIREIPPDGAKDWNEVLLNKIAQSKENRDNQEYEYKFHR